MSLSKVNVGDIVKKQYKYKLKSFIWVFNSLILLQLLGLLFSLGGTMSSGSSGDGFFLQIHYYSADVMIVFTMLWAFITGMQVTANKENEFMFITNRSSTHLSDAIFLSTMSIIGGITAILAGFLLKTIVVIFFDQSVIVITGLTAGPKYFIIGMMATILFVFLCSALGYIVGKLTILNKVFIFLLPVLFVGLLLIADRYGKGNFMIELFSFYFAEPVFTMFVLKVIVTSAALFGAAFMISKRSGVRP